MHCAKLEGKARSALIERAPGFVLHANYVYAFYVNVYIQFPVDTRCQ